MDVEHRDGDVPEVPTGGPDRQPLAARLLGHPGRARRGAQRLMADPWLENGSAEGCLVIMGDKT